VVLAGSQIRADGRRYATGQGPTTHVVPALPAARVSATPGGNLAGDDVDEQLAELDGQFQALAGPIRVCDHVAAAVDTTVNTTTLTALGGGGLIAVGTVTGRRMKFQAHFSVSVAFGFVAVSAKLLRDGVTIASTLLHPTAVVSATVMYAKPEMIFEVGAQPPGEHSYELRIKQDGSAVSVVVGGQVDAPRLTGDEILE
jgi:hypothetical protein